MHHPTCLKIGPPRGRRRSTFLFVYAVAVFGFSAHMFSETALAAGAEMGEKIYQKHCVSCHGAEGWGVADVNDKPLHGDKPFEELVQVIEETMPEEHPELCVGKDAKKVARYLYDNFYTAAARSKQQASRIQLSRLTVRQYRNAIADLLASFGGSAALKEKRGLRGQYFDSRGFQPKQRRIDRVDPEVRFDFGEAAPAAEQFDASRFSIRWEGSVLAEETGEYEFIVRTEHAARLWVNDEKKMLIDAWVKSGDDNEYRGSVFLLGGRAYPLRLEFTKAKQGVDDSKKGQKPKPVRASIALAWKPPRKSDEVIPQRNLLPQRTPRVFALAAPFPADDGSSGYERGTSVSKRWDEAATYGAIEVANYVVDHLQELAGCRGETTADEPRLREFCRRFAARAFGRPLEEPQQRFFVQQSFAMAADLPSAVKTTVLLVLKSPRFLYPGLASAGEENANGGVDSYAAASRLSFGLWDSLPDDTLLDAAEHDALKTPKQIARQAERMLKDPRAKSKIRYFLQHWLQLDEKEKIAKDASLFPNFDDALASDLRTSLDLFLDDVVWSDASDYRNLFLADYLYMNERLAAFYGVDLPAGAGFRKVSFQDGQRAGIVTHPYLLATFAYHNLSSPIHRGVFITRRLLGRTLSPPPQATEFKEGDFEPHMTTREKIALLTQPVACNTCHSVINPLGFSLEHYDAVGRYREKEQSKVINAVSPYTTAGGGIVELQGAEGLARFIANSEQAHGASVDQLFHQAVKQPINAFGPDVRQNLIHGFKASDYNIRRLLVEIMKASVPFASVPH